MSVTRRERTVPTTERLLEIKGHWVLRLAFRSRALRPLGVEALGVEAIGC